MGATRSGSADPGGTGAREQARGHGGSAQQCTGPAWASAATWCQPSHRRVPGYTGAQRPRRAAPCARCAERRARSAGRDQARRRRRAHCARTTGAERVARGGASWHAVGRQQRWEAFASASATLSLTSLVSGLKTMSPAPGRRPPINAPPQSPDWYNRIER